MGEEEQAWVFLGCGEVEEIHRHLNGRNGKAVVPGCLNRAEVAEGKRARREKGPKDMPGKGGPNGDLTKATA